MIIDDDKKDFAIINSDKYFQLAIPDNLLILTDVNKKYLITLSEALVDADKNIIIDYYEADINTVVSNCQYSDCHISIVSEIVTKILSLCKIKISSEIANYLLVVFI